MLGITIASSVSRAFVGGAGRKHDGSELDGTAVARFYAIVQTDQHRTDVRRNPR
jgi:hypothetical protein